MNPILSSLVHLNMNLADKDKQNTARCPSNNPVKLSPSWVRFYQTSKSKEFIHGGKKRIWTTLTEIIKISFCQRKKERRDL